LISLSTTLTSRAKAFSIDRSISKRPLNEKGEKAPVTVAGAHPESPKHGSTPPALDELLVTHCSSRPTRDKGFFQFVQPTLRTLEGILKQVQTCAHLDHLDAYSIDVSHPRAAFKQMRNIMQKSAW
jgi:hypothetical protein